MVENFWGGLRRTKLKEEVKRKLKKFKELAERERKKKYVSVFPELRKKIVKKKKKKRKIKKIVYFK